MEIAFVLIEKKFNLIKIIKKDRRNLIKLI